MRKLQLWFNGLSPQRQKVTLVIFCLLFAALLMLSICDRHLQMNTGNIVQPRIKNETSKHR